MTSPRIALKSLKVSHRLSEETTAYTAVVALDGKPVLHASNHGTGGPDLYRRHERATPELERALFALARELNHAEPPDYMTEIHGSLEGARAALAKDGDDTALERIVGRLLDAHEEAREIARLARKHIVFRHDRKLYTIKGAYAPERAAAVLQRYPGATILNPEHPRG